MYMNTLPQVEESNLMKYYHLELLKNISLFLVHKSPCCFHFPKSQLYPCNQGVCLHYISIVEAAVEGYMDGNISMTDMFHHKALYKDILLYHVP